MADLIEFETGNGLTAPEMSRPMPGSQSMAHAQHANGCTVDLVTSSAALQSYRSAIDELAERTLEPYFGFETGALLAEAEHLAGGVIRWLLVWYRSPGAEQARQLIGLFTFSATNFRWVIPTRLLMSFDHRHCHLSTPMVDRDFANVAFQAWLHWLETAENGHYILFERLRLDGPLWPMLQSVTGAHGGRAHIIERHHRALLRMTDEGGARDYLRKSLSRKKHKEYRRQMRRLSEQGEVQFGWHHRAHDVSQAFARFHDLEAQGWKGRRATAIAKSSDVRSYYAKMINELGADEQCIIIDMCCGDRMIASALLFRAGTEGWLTKITYDEDYGQFSPGVQLVLHITDRLTTKCSSITEVDSCAVPRHPMINHIWRETREVGVVLISTSKQSSIDALVLAAERFRRRIRQVGKRVYYQFKGWTR